MFLKKRKKNAQEMNQEESPFYHGDLWYNDRNQQEMLSSQPDPPRVALPAFSGGGLLSMSISSLLRWPISGLSDSLDAYALLDNVVPSLKYLKIVIELSALNSPHLCMISLSLFCGPATWLAKELWAETMRHFQARPLFAV